MSRIAKKPVTIPSGVEVTLNDEQVQVKGQLGNLTLARHVLVNIARGEGGALEFAPADGSRQAKALSGTLRQLVNNMVVGVSQGFEKKLELRGVGYRAAASGQQLNLSVGYSHPVSFDMPAGITAATPTPTEIILKGADRQAVGQLAAVIRAVRPPEPYKGKGIRYAGEVVIMKETKKK